MQSISNYIKGDILQLIAKPNSPKTEVIGYDENRKALRIAVAAAPDKDKANIELLRFLKKETGKRFEIVAGHHTRQKTVRIL